jgi:hypothetical protein
MKAKLRKFYKPYRIFFLIYLVLFLGAVVFEAVNKSHGPDLIQEFIGSFIIWGALFLVGGLTGSIVYWGIAFIMALLWHSGNSTVSNRSLDDPTFMANDDTSFTNE